MSILVATPGQRSLLSICSPMHAHERRSIQGISTRVPKGAHRATGGAMHGVMGQCMFMHAMARMHGGVWLVWWIWHKINRTNLVAAQLSKELTRQVSTAGAERSEKQSTAIPGSKTIPSWS